MTRPSRSNAASSLGHPVEVGRAGPNREPQGRRGHERLVEVRLLGEQADGQAALAMDLAAVRLVAAGGEAQEGRLAGAVGPDQPDPVAERDGRVDAVEDDERADLAGHAGQSQDAHRARLRTLTRAPPRGGWPRPASCARSGSWRRPAQPRLSLAASGRGSPPRPARSSVGRAGRGRRSSSAGSPSRPRDPPATAAGTTNRSGWSAPR